MATQVETLHKEQLSSEENKQTDTTAGEQLTSNPTHPLQNEWTLWFFQQDSTKDWGDCFQEIISFNTIEGFWSCFRFTLENFVETISFKVHKASRPSPNNCNYSVFKKGIRPMWEDPANMQGGRWLIQITRVKEGIGKASTAHWFETLMLLIGEAFIDEQSPKDEQPLSNDICGAVIEIKQKNDRLALWSRDLNKARQDRIGKILKNTLQKHAGLSNFVLFQFFSHADSSKEGKSKVICQV
ncbi:Eukaryotic translation initiation factor 4E-like [Oopsacas minuta]|uniref:Eukaryotic translation initiation factor 4E-like n=1 Tax=Oopsacas minuta TaxID=111878 RepID=A0AAV7JJB8_9METZ|nr:Eukaryotic translation initiation factor 4E-like [Oopsacas minuta]